MSDIQDMIHKEWISCEYAAPILRIGLSLVFLWFGLNQIFVPQNFVGYVPSFTYNLVSPLVLLFVNGIAETILGTLLLLGFFVRISALFLALHLIGIIVSLGYNDVAVRDVGLMIATFSVCVHGPDRWCLRKKKPIVDRA